jgi:hypothetical protein
VAAHVFFFVCAYSCEAWPLLAGYAGSANRDPRRSLRLPRSTVVVGAPVRSLPASDVWQYLAGKLSTRC